MSPTINYPMFMIM